MIRSLTPPVALLAALAPAVASAQVVAARTTSPAELMRRAEAIVATDPAGAAALVGVARARYVRTLGAAAPEVALADYRLALTRALGGDRRRQLAPMAAAAERLASRAATPEQRTVAGSALIVAASFTMSSGDAALTDRLRDAAVVLLNRADLARTPELAEAWRVVADVLIYQNQPAVALDWATRAVALYERTAPGHSGLVYALARRGSALQRLSRDGEALADLRRAVIQADRAQARDPVVQVYALRALGTYYWRLAEVDYALPLLRRALDIAQPLPPGFPYAGGLSRDIMLVLLDADRPDEARVFAEQTASRARSTMGATSYEYASALLVLARLDIGMEDLPAATRRIEEAEAIFATALVADNSRRFEPVVARGDLAAAQGQEAEAAALYDRAGTMLAHLPPDDVDRIDLAADAAAARLTDEGASPAAWTAARAAADGLTTRIARQVAGAGAIDGGRARGERVFTTALDVAWGRRADPH